MIRYGKGQRGISAEHLYAHFFGVGHERLSDVSVKIIDKTNVNEPTIREGSGHINWIVLFQWDWTWETSSELISL